MTAPVIDTPRLILRGPRQADFAAYADLMASDRARHVGGPCDRRAAWQTFAAEAGLWLLRGFGFWTLEDRASGAVAGWAGVYYPDYYDEPELGWFLTAPFEGQGLAAEAARAARREARHRFGLDRLASFISAGNVRSIRLAERLGAVRERSGTGPDGPFHLYRHPAEDLSA